MTERMTVHTASPYEPLFGISRAVRIGSQIVVADAAPKSQPPARST